MRKLVVAALACLLAGCGTTTVRDVATSPDTLAVCKAADVATTAQALHSGHFVETNRMLVALGGAHSAFPAAVVGVVLWYVVKNAATPGATAAANGVTCAAAAINGWGLLR